MAGLVGVERLVAHPLQKAVDGGFAVVGQECFQRLAGKGLIFGVGIVGPGGADDLEILGHELVIMQRAERGQQHALGQIASGTEQQKAVCGKTHIFPT